MRNSGLLQRKLSAALVCSLANVNAFTKIVLMDTRGGSTKPLARDISSQGYRAYCLKGGYTLWRRTGLSTKKGTYDVSAGVPSSSLHLFPALCTIYIAVAHKTLYFTFVLRQAPPAICHYCCTAAALGDLHA